MRLLLFALAQLFAISTWSSALLAQGPRHQWSERVKARVGPMSNLTLKHAYIDF